MAVVRTFTLEEFSQWLQEHGRSIERMDLDPAFQEIGVMLAGASKKNFAAGTAPDGSAWDALAHPRPDGSAKPLNDFGLLAASLSSRGLGHVERKEGNALIWGTNRIEAATHQFGATIEAKNASMLAIPLTRAAARLRSPRDFPGGLFVWKGPHAAFLAQSVDDKLELQYVLVKSVVIPARPFIGLSDEIIGDIGDILMEHAIRQFGDG